MNSARFASCKRWIVVTHYPFLSYYRSLLRTSFLADYFTNPLFRHELRRVLNRGEAVNSMKRLIYVDHIVPAQAKQDVQMQAVADALNLHANIVMAWANRRRSSRRSSLRR